MSLNWQQAFVNLKEPFVKLKEATWSENNKNKKKAFRKTEWRQHLLFNRGRLADIWFKYIVNAQNEYIQYLCCGQEDVTPLILLGGYFIVCLAY